MSETTTALSQPPSEQPATPPAAAPAAQQAPAADPAKTPTGEAPKSPAAPVAPSESWRQDMSGGDEKLLQELSRFKSPGDIAKEVLRQKQELSKRAQPVVLGKDATPEQVAAYREAMGVPKDGTIEAYGIKPPEGYTMSAEETALVGEFAKTMHGLHVAPSVVQAATAHFFQAQAKAQVEAAKLDKDRGKAWNEERKEARGRDDDALLEASRTFLQNHEWVKRQDDPQAAMTDLLHARLPGGGYVGDHPLIHELLADAALRGGYGDRIMANELEAGAGKSLAEQQAEIKNLRFTNKTAYDAAMAPGGKYEKIVNARISRGEIDEQGNTIRRRVTA